MTSKHAKHVEKSNGLSSGGLGRLSGHSFTPASTTAIIISLIKAVNGFVFTLLWEFLAWMLQSSTGQKECKALKVMWLDLNVHTETGSRMRSGTNTSSPLRLSRRSTKSAGPSASSKAGCPALATKPRWGQTMVRLQWKIELQLLENLRKWMSPYRTVNNTGQSQKKCLQG